MKATIREQLKSGKKIKVKHLEYGFTIHAELRLENSLKEPQVYLEKISLPVKATKGEKLLFKLVNIYCYEVLCNNLLNDIIESKEYKKVLTDLK